MVPTVLSQTIELNNTYLAFESTQDPLVAPTEAQYQQVIDQTIAFWDTILAALPDVGGRYIDTTVEIEFTQLNAAQPMDNFNMLIDLASINVRFEGSSDGLPSRDDLFMILRDSIQDNQEFVSQSINTVSDSAALVGVNKAVLRKAMLDPPQEEIIPAGDAIVRVESFYLAYVSLEDPVTEPTEEQYAQVVQQTVSYFEKVAADFTDIGASFLSAVAVLNSTQIAAGIPAQRFNILMNYEYIDLIFAQGTENLPSPPDAFQLLRNSLTGAYLTDYVFTVSNTAFDFVNEFVMRDF